MVQKDLLTKLSVTSIGENIGRELATDFVSAYTEANPNDVGSYMVGRDIIDQILAQPGCVGDDGQGVAFKPLLCENIHLHNGKSPHEKSSRHLPLCLNRILSAILEPVSGLCSRLRNPDS